MKLQPEFVQPSEPARARALFSTEDFTLIRMAISEYMQQAEDQNERRKLANLFHRLGRMV
ncbi:hypothetical protein NGM99_05910 [Mesorhizobium sp. RP14(2022)]|uniref:Transcriptional regulator n=1 Tax=Mesorhizobium liriopis TaxID=2953882 RepID=A0ABT1C3C0_9HYPH|nr:hypothetical protein [Mesorhizobium liriopis]MCO6049323.1 hypothetical protein [Mesorhizobium liriopis]